MSGIDYLPFTRGLYECWNGHEFIAPDPHPDGVNCEVGCTICHTIETDRRDDAMVAVWLDDERPAPEGWVACRWPAEVIDLLEQGAVAQMSLDHDLGDDARGTGYDVLAWLEDAVAMRGYKPPTIHVHTSNPAARARMLAAVDAIGRLSR